MLKPDIFAAIMDFFATDQPILNKEAECTVPDADSGQLITVLLYYSEPMVIIGPNSTIFLVV